MMAALAEATQLKIALEKAVSDESEASVLDILAALSKLPMTEDMLRATKLGVIVNKFAKAPGGAFTTSSTTLAKEVVSKWKNAVKAPVVVAPAGPGSAEKKTSISVSVAAANRNADARAAPCAAGPRTPTASITLTQAQSSQLSHYAEGRKHIVKLLQENIYIHVADSESAGTEAEAGTESEAEAEAVTLAQQAQTTLSVQNSVFRVALDIENEVNSLVPYATNSKGYCSKAKTLTVNLKRNETLAMEVLSGALTPAALCQLSVDQLATQQEQAEQQQILQRKFDAGRTDYYDAVLRDKVMKLNGLDPDAAGEFTCRKCKGTKTSHYSMQTRSSDEPMTVFVRCLGCGTRWRC